MKVADVQIFCGRHSFGACTIHAIGFDDALKAKAEFDRLSDLLKRRAERANDLEKTVVVTGISEFTCDLNEILAVSYGDYAKLNEQEAGVKDAFPNLFKH